MRATCWPNQAGAPSTVLWTVPLPRFTGEDKIQSFFMHQVWCQNAFGYRDFHPPLLANAKRGRGTMRSMVEGALFPAHVMAREDGADGVDEFFFGDELLGFGLALQIGVVVGFLFGEFGAEDQILHQHMRA